MSVREFRCHNLQISPVGDPVCMGDGYCRKPLCACRKEFRSGSWRLYVYRNFCGFIKRMTKKEYDFSNWQNFELSLF